MADFSLSIPSEDASDCPSEERVISLVNSVFKGEGLKWEAISVVLADHQAVLDLNIEWLKHDYHTDVLSFLLEDDPDAIEGEVYVDIETARERYAEFAATSITQEIERYIVHGLLHLTGLDDETEDEKTAMKLLEDKYLAA
ncbi:MAG: rRNA maturation RNase YbeY [Bacteroidetes bacterium]|nr:rRNA maturation RNase YbeY [Bacteroidota bacterium]